MEIDEERLFKWLVFIFPIVAIWLGTFLHEFVMMRDEWYAISVMESSFGIAYFITAVLIELALIFAWHDA